MVKKAYPFLPSERSKINQLVMKEKVLLSLLEMAADGLVVLM